MEKETCCIKYLQKLTFHIPGVCILYECIPFRFICILVSYNPHLQKMIVIYSGSTELENCFSNCYYSCLVIVSLLYVARQTGIKPKTAVLTFHMKGFQRGAKSSTDQHSRSKTRCLTVVKSIAYPLTRELTKGKGYTKCYIHETKLPSSLCMICLTSVKKI